MLAIGLKAAQMAYNQARCARLRHANGGQVYLTDVIALAGWGLTALFAFACYVKSGQYTMFENAMKEAQAFQGSFDVKEANTHLENVQGLISQYDGYKTHIDTAADASQSKLAGIENETNATVRDATLSHVKFSVQNNLEQQVELERANLNHTKWGLGILAVISGVTGTIGIIASLDRRGR